MTSHSVNTNAWMDEHHSPATQFARLGLRLPEPAAGAYWMQVYDGIFKRSQTFPVELVYLGVGDSDRHGRGDERLTLFDDLTAQELDVLIDWSFSESLAYPLLNGGLAIVHLSETSIRHPLSVSPLGLGLAAEEVAAFVVDRLGGKGEVLVVGGLSQPGLPDDGKSRLAGVSRVFSRHSGIRYHHVASHWDLERARPQIRDALIRRQKAFDAIVGLSDPLALLARDIACDLGRCRDHVVVTGFNGDSMGIAAILNGIMHATVETSAAMLGARAVELAYRIAFDQACEPHFAYQTRLITSETATSAAAERLAAFDKLLNIPFNLLERERVEHLAHLETSRDISRHLSSIIDERDLPSDLNTLIQEAYGFNHLRLVNWDRRKSEFCVLEPGPPDATAATSIEAAEIYRDAYSGDRLVLVPDQRSSLRYEQDSQQADIRTRVVLPVHSNGRTRCLLDLTADRIVTCSRVQLLGLQALADQLGTALQNTRLSRRKHRSRDVPDQDDPSNSEDVTGDGHVDDVPPPATAPPAQPVRRASTLTDQAVTYVHEHYNEPITRCDLATALGVSENYLTDLFHRETGTSLWTYLNRHRVKQAKVLLVSTGLTITEIAMRTGFDDPAYFSRVFRRCTGRSPRAFRKSLLDTDIGSV